MNAFRVCNLLVDDVHFELLHSWARQHARASEGSRSRPGLGFRGGDSRYLLDQNSRMFFPVDARTTNAVTPRMARPRFIHAIGFHNSPIGPCRPQRFS